MITPNQKPKNLEYIIRPDEIDGFRDWKWIKDDHGSWDGPTVDWMFHHKRNIEKYCSQFRTVVQAGGNQGLYPKLLSAMFENVYTFEPDLDLFNVLTENCKDRNNIHAYNVGLGQNHDSVPFNECDMSNTGTHTVITGAIPADAIYIPMVKLDTFTINNLDLIMFDMEGYECEAILGAANHIDQHKPVIFAERPTGRLNQVLEEWGYTKKVDSKMDSIYTWNKP